MRWGVGADSESTATRVMLTMQAGGGRWVWSKRRGWNDQYYVVERLTRALGGDPTLPQLSWGA
jgi:hypothetical protein